MWKQASALSSHVHKKSQWKRSILIKKKKRKKNPSCLFIKINYTIKKSEQTPGLATQDADIKRATAVIALRIGIQEKKKVCRKPVASYVILQPFSHNLRECPRIKLSL